MMIKEIRNQKGLSQRALAVKARMSFTNLCNVENGKISPSINTIKRLAKVLNVSWLDLLGRPNSRRGRSIVTYKKIYGVSKDSSLTPSKRQNRLEALFNTLIREVSDKPPTNKSESDSYWHKATEISREICRVREGKRG